MDKIRKPTLYEAPKTYAKNQLYEPIKFYKLVKQEGRDMELENRVREQIDQTKSKTKKKNPLDRHVFLDKMTDNYGSLKDHRSTANRFYNQLAGQAFKKQRRRQAITHSKD